MANELKVKQVKAAPLVIDMNRIYQIESSGNPQAHNRGTDARGLGQVTPIALQDYNQLNPREQYTQEQLFDAATNQKISQWTMNYRIPQMLRHFGIPDTVENRLAAYNWGIGNVVKLHKGQAKLPPETINYQKKYLEMANENNQVRQ